MQQDIMNCGASPSLSANSPSLTTYSSENIADIAARVVHELNLSQPDDPFDDFYSSIELPNDDVDDDVESEFEFAVLRGEDTSSPISADEIFYNGQIKPSYPLFNTSLIYGDDQNDVVVGKTTSLRVPLRELMSEDREIRNQGVSGSSSSDESNAELEGVPPESYCVWAPQKDAVTMKKKSNSTGSGPSGVGSSKRWRFKDLLPRSSSDGKDSFVFLTSNDKRREKVIVVNNGGKKIEEVKKKSYLPYRQDLVGLFSNVNGLSRTIRPF